MSSYLNGLLSISSIVMFFIFNPRFVFSCLEDKRIDYSPYLYIWIHALKQVILILFQDQCKIGIYFLKLMRQHPIWDHLSFYNFLIQYLEMAYCNDHNGLFLY